MPLPRGVAAFRFEAAAGMAPLNVLASDLNPGGGGDDEGGDGYPLKFGPDLQHEIDKWVKWVGVRRKSG